MYPLKTRLMYSVPIKAPKNKCFQLVSMIKNNSHFQANSKQWWRLLTQCNLEFSHLIQSTPHWCIRYTICLYRQYQNTKVYAQSVMKLTSSSETYCKFNIMMARLKLTANSNRFGDAFLVQCNLTRATSKFSWHTLAPPPPPLTSLLKNLTFLAKLKLREKEWPWTNFDPS